MVDILMSLSGLYSPLKHEGSETPSLSVSHSDIALQPSET